MFENFCGFSPTSQVIRFFASAILLVGLGAYFMWLILNEKYEFKKRGKNEKVK